MSLCGQRLGGVLGLACAVLFGASCSARPGVADEQPPAPPNPPLAADAAPSRVNVPSGTPGTDGGATDGHGAPPVEAGTSRDVAAPPDAVPAAPADAQVPNGRFMPLRPSTASLRFGADQVGKRLLVGDMDRARIWTRAITPAEVNALWNRVWVPCDAAGACVGDWNFDGPSGGGYQSSGPIPLPAKLVGDGQQVQGQEGGAVALRGGYLEVAHHPALASTDAVSVAVWVRWAADCPAALGGCSRMTFADKDSWLHFEAVKNHFHLAAQVAQPGAFDSAQVSSKPDVWHLLVFTFERTAINYYVDGKASRRPHTPDGTTFELKPSTSPLVFGNRSSNRQEGAIDQVRFYSRALTAAEIAAEAAFQYPPCTPAGHCVVEWNFDSVRPEAVASSAGASLTGTSSGTVEIVDGIRGKAVRLTGGQIDVPNAPALAFQGSASFSAWVQRDPLCPPERTDRCYLERIFTKGSFMFSFRENTGWEYITGGNIMLSGGPAPKRGEWSHVAVTVDPVDGARIYSGGKLVRGWLPGVPDNLCYACSGNPR